MAKYKYVDASQWQTLVLNVAELFPSDHALRNFYQIIERLDFSKFDEGYKNDHGVGGRPAIPVQRMLALIIYSLLYGNISMRHLERDMHVRADLLFLSGGLQISHSAFSVFRKRHAEAIRECFAQTVFLGIESDLIDLETVCIDSTKIKASANRRDIGTYEELSKRYELVREACAQRQKEWEACADGEEKAELEQKLRKRQKHLNKLENAVAFLAAHPEQKRVHMTDADADWHKTRSDAFIVGYAAQIAIDYKSGMVVTQYVTKDQSDQAHALPMVKATEEVRQTVAQQQKPDGQDRIAKKTKYVMDCGYASENNLAELIDYDTYIPDSNLAREFAGKTKPEDRTPGEPIVKFTYDKGKDQFHCPQGKISDSRRHKNFGREAHYEYRFHGCSACPLLSTCVGENAKRKQKRLYVKKSCLPDLETKISYAYGSKNANTPQGKLTQQMRAKLQTKEGRMIYNRRFYTVESVFGTIKAARNGFQFLRRGLDRVQVEWTERCIAHNIAKLIGFSQLALV